MNPTGGRTPPANDQSSIRQCFAIAHQHSLFRGRDSHIDVRQPAGTCRRCLTEGRLFCDSITKRGYPEEPGKIPGVTIVNAGIPGNTTADSLKRLQTGVLDQHPSIVIVLFGTNDSRQDATKIHVPVAQYISILKQMITRCEAIHARVVLCTIPH